MTTRTGFDFAKINVINSKYEFCRIFDELKRDCEDFNVLGFDCEWIPNDGPVALLQLATARGNMYLIRTCKMKQMPEDLRKLLEDINLIKVGIDPWRDVKKLKEKYDVNTRGTLDLRYLAEECGFRPMGLGKLAHEHLRIHLHKVFSETYFEWEDKELNFTCQQYAAEDAFVAIELFKSFANVLQQDRLSIPMEPIRSYELLIKDIIDKRYAVINGPHSAKQKFFGIVNRGKGIDSSYESLRFIANTFSEFVYMKYAIPREKIFKMDFNHVHIRIINTDAEYGLFKNSLEMDCNEFNVLGFGCEWMIINGKRSIVLLELATVSGLILLIRLCKIDSIPAHLKKILENDEIIKASFTPNDRTHTFDEVAQFKQQFDVSVKGVLDLRFLAEKFGTTPFNKSQLASKYTLLGIKLYDDTADDFFLKHKKPQNKWEDNVLDYTNITYAAEQALASLELFKSFISPNILWIPAGSDFWQKLVGRDCLDKPYYRNGVQPSQDRFNTSYSCKMMRQSQQSQQVQQTQRGAYNSYLRFLFLIFVFISLAVSISQFIRL